MPSQKMETAPDLATVERLSTAFNRCFETLDAGEDVFAPRCVLRPVPAVVAFPAPGSRRVRRPAPRWNPGEATSRVLRVVPTVSGFVMEHEVTKSGTKAEVARHLWLLEVRVVVVSDRSMAMAGPMGAPPKPRSTMSSISERAWQRKLTSSPSVRPGWE